MGISMLLFLFLAIFVPKLVHCDKSEDVHWTTKASTTKAPTTTTIGQETTNLCENPSSVIFPVCATYNANLSLADPNYLNEITWFYKVASLRGACFFKHNLYRCPLPENQTTTVTTTTTEPTTTESTTTEPTTTEPTTTSTTTLPVSTDPCIARRTGVDIPLIGNLLVGPNSLNFDQSVDYCAAITGCNMWIPQGNASVISSLIYNITVPCNDGGDPAYWIGVFSETMKDINGNSWNFSTLGDDIDPSFPGIVIEVHAGLYYSGGETAFAICQCGS